MDDFQAAHKVKRLPEWLKWPFFLLLTEHPKYLKYLAAVCGVVVSVSSVVNAVCSVISLAR